MQKVIINKCFGGYGFDPFTIQKYADEKGICVGICDAQENMYGAADVVFLDDIKEIPAADVEQVRHGQWKTSDFASHYMVRDKCSACGWRSRGYEDMLWAKRCPNCGAKMDLGCEIE